MNHEGPTSVTSTNRTELLDPQRICVILEALTEGEDDNEKLSLVYRLAHLGSQPECVATGAHQNWIGEALEIERKLVESNQISPWEEDEGTYPSPAADAAGNSAIEALRLAWPILHYFGHAPGEQVVNASPSQRQYREACEAARKVLEGKDVAEDYRLDPKVGEVGNNPLLNDGRKVWLVWSHEHSSWWRANHSGYTNHVEAAGRYTFGEALEISHGAEGGEWTLNESHKHLPNEVMVPAPELIAEALRKAAG